MSKGKKEGEGSGGGSFRLVWFCSTISITNQTASYHSCRKYAKIVTFVEDEIVNFDFALGYRRTRRISQVFIGT